MRPQGLDLRPERTDLRLERDDLRLERADLWPERDDLRPKTADLRPQRPSLKPEKQENKQTDKWTNRRKSPYVPQDFVPFGAAAQKQLKMQRFWLFMTDWSFRGP